MAFASYPCPIPRAADPWRDLDVIDSRAPRANQLVIGSLALAATLTGAWPLLALGALQLTLTLKLGRRWCLACRAYFAWVQPRFGQGSLEDSRPVRFATQVGATFLWGATALHLAGLHAAGAVLGALVAFLALLAATTGLCAGCAMYRLAPARLTRRSSGTGGGSPGSRSAGAASPPGGRPSSSR